MCIESGTIQAFVIWFHVCLWRVCGTEHWREPEGSSLDSSRIGFWRGWVLGWLDLFVFSLGRNGDSGKRMSFVIWQHTWEDWSSCFHPKVGLLNGDWIKWGLHGLVNYPSNYPFLAECVVKRWGGGRWGYGLEGCILVSRSPSFSLFPGCHGVSSSPLPCPSFSHAISALEKIYMYWTP